jgi:sporulation integral membrane protein YtvI
MDPELLKSLKKLVKLSIFVMALIAVYLLFTYVFPIFAKIMAYFPIIFMPFIFAIGLALLIEPVVSMFEKYVRLKRSWAVFLSLTLVIGGFFSILSMLVTVTIREMSGLYRLALSHSDQVIVQVMTFLSNFRLSYLQLNLPPQVQDAIQDNLQNGVLLLQHLMNSSINGLVQGFASLPGILVFIAISTVATFFIIKDRALIRTYVIDILPSPARSKTRDVISGLLKAISGFFKAYGILVTITAIITLIALKIIGVKYAFTLGILIGILDILPVLGPGAIIVPWVIWELMNGNTSMGISLMVIYGTISVVRQFLEPQIVGDSIGLHPLATLVSLYVGLQLGGLVGMILGPVLVVIFIASFRAGLLDRYDWREKRE